MKKYYKFIFILVLLYAVVGIGNSFNQSGMVFADTASISIDNVAPVNVYDEDLNFFTVTATVNDATLMGTDIEWILNGNPVTDQNTITNPSITPKKSIIKIYRLDFIGVSALDVWVFRATITGQPTIYAEVSVTFKTSPSPLSIQPQTSITQQYSPNNMSAFVFSVAGLEEVETVQWYMLENSNKYIIAPGTSNQRTYSYTPTKAGEFTFKAMVDTEISQAFKVTVEYAPITTIDFTVSLQTENRNGFNTYLFRITNLDSTNDIDNLNWYIEGYTNPIQYGGTMFLFQPTAYGTYRIVARYGSVKSITHTIDVKINRTVEILIGSLVVVGVMGIGLLIIIIRNIKREKVW